MAVLKLSQISASGANFTSGDFLVAVQGGTTDVLFSFAQLFGGANLVYASDVLAQQRGVNAQSFQVYNTFTDAGNYERGVFDWQTTANKLRIGTEVLGSGTARDFLLFSAHDITVSAANGRAVELLGDSILIADVASPGSFVGVSRVTGTPNAIAFGNGLAGDATCCIKAKTKAGAFTTSDVADGTWVVGRDTSGATTKVYYNNAGTLMTASLT